MTFHDSSNEIPTFAQSFVVRAILITVGLLNTNARSNLNGGRAGSNYLNLYLLSTLAVSANAPSGRGSSWSHTHSILLLWAEVKQGWRDWPVNEIGKQRGLGVCQR
jgi:hypothetical protein